MVTDSTTPAAAPGAGTGTGTGSPADAARDALPPHTHPGQRVLDVDSLRGLAHPLRIQLLEILGSRGPLTASGLASLTGESSGTTSYHLRQLARHGFIEEVADRGTARERWWGTRPGGFTVPTGDLAGTGTANREAVSLVNRELLNAQHRHLLDAVEHGPSTMPPEWTDASLVSTVSLRLTADELAEVSQELMDLSRRLVERFRTGRDRPEAHPVQMNLNAFPILTEETP